LINEAFRFMSVNWLQSTTEQRKALYKVAKSVATTTPLTLERFLNKAFPFGTATTSPLSRNASQFSTRKSMGGIFVKLPSTLRSKGNPFGKRKSHPQEDLSHGCEGAQYPHER